MLRSNIRRFTTPPKGLRSRLGRAAPAWRTVSGRPKPRARSSGCNARPAAVRRAGSRASTGCRPDHSCYPKVDGDPEPGRALGRTCYCSSQANQRHTAGCPAFEVRITYPFHPRSGEMVAVVGSKRHAGADHLVIRQPDRTLALLPVWMTAPAAASHQLVSPPRLSIESLAEVRALVDALLASSGRESSRRKGAMRSERHSQRDLFEER